MTEVKRMFPFIKKFLFSCSLIPRLMFIFHF